MSGWCEGARSHHIPRNATQPSILKRLISSSIIASKPQSRHKRHSDNSPHLSAFCVHCPFPYFRTVSRALAVRSGNHSAPPSANPISAPSPAILRTASTPVTKIGIWMAGAASIHRADGGGLEPEAAAARRRAGKPLARAEGSFGSRPGWGWVGGWVGVQSSSVSGQHR